MRELCWMAQSRDMVRWNHTLAIIGQMYNTHRDPKSEAIDVLQFIPWPLPEQPPAPPPSSEERAMLKSVFTGS